jgi:hypothetical protein
MNEENKESVPLAEGAVDISKHTVEDLKNKVSSPTMPTKEQIMAMKSRHQNYIRNLKEMNKDLEVEVKFLELNLRKTELELKTKEMFPNTPENEVQE